MKDQDLERTKGDGGSRPAAAEDLAGLRNEIEQIRRDIADHVQARKRDNANTRFCKWDGQSPDGRKRAKHLGRKPMPFEGASDCRVRTADEIINERVDDYLAAATRTVPRAIGMEGTDEATAGKIGTLLKWLIKNQWGSAFGQEVELLGQWMEGDTPAVSILGVFWRRENALELKKVTEADVLGMLAQRMPEVTDETLQYVQDLLMFSEREPELIQLVLGLFPEVTEKRARRIARDLYRSGEAEFPSPYVRYNVPELRALRVYEDIFFRGNVRDIQRAPGVFMPTWLTAAEVIEAAAREGWDPEFVKELLGEENGGGPRGKEGLSAFEDPGDLGIATENLQNGVDPRKGLFEVIYCWLRSANDDGQIGLYEQVISGLCEIPATGRKLLSAKHGQLPLVVCARERTTRTITDARPVSELVSTQQNSQKMIADSIEDHVQVLTNPPLVVPKGNPKYQYALAPFGQLEAGPRENVKLLERPSYPVAAEKHWERTQAQIDSYFGRENAAIPPGRSVLARQIRVDRFLGYLHDGLMLAVQLCQENLTDEDVARIVGGAGLPMARSREEIQGKFDLQLSFDVRDLDSEYVIKKSEMLLKYVRPLDTKGALPWEQFVANIVQAIDPNWADQIPPAAMAQGRVIQEEQTNFLKMLNGIEPEMPENPENPELRMQVLEQSLAPRQQQPEAFGPMTPAAQAIIENRMKYLTQAMEQQRNAVIGRTGAAPVFG
jgi:hypothetical protein